MIGLTEANWGGQPMSDTAEIDLAAVRFPRQTVSLLQTSGMTVEAFRYSTGVKAIRIVTPAGTVVVLPFKGQQVWDATFRGRRLTMTSIFDEPQATTDYLSTYGAFLLHCGIAAIGAPGAGDNHPLHGELPNALFQSARLIAGTDDIGPFLKLVGSSRQRRSFAHNYLFCSEITLRPEATHLDVSVAAENLSEIPLDVMYLAHINFRPVDNGRLIDTVLDDRTDIEVRRHLLPGLAYSAEFLSMNEALCADPAVHRQLLSRRRIDPEVVLFLKCQPDSDGWAHGLQVHPDGNADFVSYKPAELPIAVRWLSRTGDLEALGLFLPSTSGVDGYTAEKAKERVKTIARRDRFTCSYRCGALDPVAAQLMVCSVDRVISHARSVQNIGGH